MCSPCSWLSYRAGMELDIRRYEYQIGLLSAINTTARLRPGPRARAPAVPPFGLATTRVAHPAQVQRQPPGRHHISSCHGPGH